MGNPSDGFTASLIVATRGRLSALAPRLAVWTAAGFDEVIIVDGSYRSEMRSAVRDLCQRTGARYVAAPVTIRDTRSLSRNLGAKEARGAWILFQDDDDDVPIRIDKEALGSAAIGMDWLTGPRGGIIVWHRREAFLAFGGYPEDMVAAEDWIMSNRARGHGPGGREPSWFEGSTTFPPPPDDPLGRVRNAFWYGYTLLLFVVRCPKRDAVIVGDSRRLALSMLRGLRQPRHFVFVGIGLLGRALSPFHCLHVARRSGWSGLRQEPYHDWQGLRPAEADSTGHRVPQV